MASTNTQPSPFPHIPHSQSLKPASSSALTNFTTMARFSIEQPMKVYLARTFLVMVSNSNNNFEAPTPMIVDLNTSLDGLQQNIKQILTLRNTPLLKICADINPYMTGCDVQLTAENLLPFLRFMQAKPGYYSLQAADE